MRSLIPAVLCLSVLTLAACDSKPATPAPAAPVVPPTTAEGSAMAPDTAPGHVRRETQAQSAQQQIEAQMAEQMQSQSASDKSDH